MAGITRAFQDGTCSICKKHKPVRVITNKNAYVCVCEKCAESLGNMSIDEVLKTYGLPK